jgi:hypothetical protein
LRHCEQWQFSGAVSGPAISNSTPPHRQRPWMGGMVHSVDCNGVVMNAGESTVGTEFFGGDSEVNRLQQRIGCRSCHASNRANQSGSNANRSWITSRYLTTRVNFARYRDA